MTDRESAAPRSVLDPGDRFEEIVFGLIMVLTFTCSLSVAEADRAEVRGMIIGALGCNLAWGIIDAAFYLIGSIVERGRGGKLLRAVQQAADPEQGRGIVLANLPAAIAGILAPAELERIRATLAERPAPPTRVRVRREDALGALGVFLLVFLSTFPVVVPFFFTSQVHTALRLSNAVAIAMIFVASFRLARHSGLRPWRTGAAMVAIGAALVAIAIALGG